MNPCSGSCENDEAEGGQGVSSELNLPPAPDFLMLPPLVSMQEMSRRIRQLRQWFPGGIPTQQERWEARIRVEFKL